MPRADDTDGADEAPRSFIQRLKALIVKPADPDRPHLPVAPEPTAEELEEANKRLDDRERLIGLAIAPLAAVLAFVLVADLTSHDPAAEVNGHPNPAHVNPTFYHELELVLLGLSVAMLAAAWFHKRLYLGVAIALYGLAVFNLHYWGFGVPFVMVGAWFMVRAYRANKAVKDVAADVRGAPGADGAPPVPNKRYTPPAPKKKPTSKPDEGRAAG